MLGFIFWLVVAYVQSLHHADWYQLLCLSIMIVARLH